MVYLAHPPKLLKGGEGDSPQTPVVSVFHTRNICASTILPHAMKFSVITNHSLATNCSIIRFGVTHPPLLHGMSYGGGGVKQSMGITGKR